MTSNGSRSANSRSEPIHVTCSTCGSAPYGSNAVTLAPAPRKSVTESARPGSEVEHSYAGKVATDEPYQFVSDPQICRSDGER